MKGLGAHIRELRDQKDISLRELARRLEVSAAFLSDIELGKRHPAEETLLAIGRELNTSIEELLEHDVRPPLEDIKRISDREPKYALAFRTMIDKQISADDLLEAIRKLEKPSQGK